MATKRPGKGKTQAHKKKAHTKARKATTKKVVKRAPKKAKHPGRVMPSSVGKTVAALRRKLGPEEYENLAARAEALHAQGLEPRALGEQLAGELKGAKIDPGVLSTVPSAP
jgi:hypothetical protein